MRRRSWMHSSIRTASNSTPEALLFSSMVALMGMVVKMVRPSVNAAYQRVKATLPVSLSAVYEKIIGLEPQVTSSLVRHSAEKLEQVVVAMNGQIPSLLPGYRARIIDGNHLAATQRRLEVLKRSKAGPLPGHSLVVLDPALMLATNMIPCKDGHAQARSWFPEILALVRQADVWIADRNAKTMLGWAGHVDLARYKRYPRRPKKPVPKRTRFVDKMAVSPARLRAKSRKKAP